MEINVELMTLERYKGVRTELVAWERGVVADGDLQWVGQDGGELKVFSHPQLNEIMRTSSVNEHGNA